MTCIIFVGDCGVNQFTLKRLKIGILYEFGLF